jgi:predicted phosphodiesterase
MKIALITDVHANLVALEAVVADIDAWGPDHVIVGGDLVNRGPRPAECLRLVQKRMASEGWGWVRGNHEDYVISNAGPDAPRRGPAFEVHQASYWTYCRLDQDVAPLVGMPFELSLLDPDGRLVRFTHGSMLGIRDGIYPETPDSRLAEKLGLNGNVQIPPLAVFAVGHTHRPLVRRWGEVLVVNAGSAGLPFDGDTRPSYARLTWTSYGWQAEIVRVNYNLQAAVDDFYATGYAQEAGPLIRLVEIELRQARSMLFSWALQYQDLALEGEISMEDSVSRFLGQP